MSFPPKRPTAPQPLAVINAVGQPLRADASSKHGLSAAPGPAVFQRSISPIQAQARNIMQTKHDLDTACPARVVPPRARTPEVPQVFHPRPLAVATAQAKSASRIFDLARPLPPRIVAPAPIAPASIRTVAAPVGLSRTSAFANVRVLPTLPGVALQAKLGAGRVGLTNATPPIAHTCPPKGAFGEARAKAVPSSSARVNMKPVIQRSALPGQLAAPPLEQVLTASDQDTRIVRELLRVPAIKAQWDQMIRVGGPISIVTRMDIDGENKGSRAHYHPNWNESTRTITIPANYSGLERVSVLSFELHNAFNGDGTGVCPIQPQHTSREQFAIGKETFEYNAVVMHHKNMRQGVEHLGWDQHVDRFRGHFGSDPMLTNWNKLDGYLATQNKGGRAGSHTDAYRRKWDVQSMTMDQSE